MSTVESEVTCPRCKNPEAVEFFNNRRMTQSTFCSKCGRHHSHDYKTGVTEEGGGYGSLRIGFKGHSRSSCFRKRKTLLKQTAGLQRTVRNQHVTSVELTVRVRGKWKTVSLKSDVRPRQHTPRNYKMAYRPLEPYSGPSLSDSAAWSEDIPF